MSGTVSKLYLDSILDTDYNEIDANILPILLMRKLRHKELKMTYLRPHSP